MTNPTPTIETTAQQEQRSYDELVKTLLDNSELDPFIPEDRQAYKQLVEQVESEGHKTKGLMDIYRGYALNKQSREEYDTAKKRKAQERFLRLFPTTESLICALTICITRLEQDLGLDTQNPFATDDPVLHQIQRVRAIIDATYEHAESAHTLVPFQGKSTDVINLNNQQYERPLHPFAQQQIDYVREGWGDQDAEYEMRVQIEAIIHNLWPDAPSKWIEQMREMVPFVILQYHLLEHYICAYNDAEEEESIITTVGLREFAEYITTGGHDGHSALQFLQTKGLGYFVNGPGSTALDNLPGRVFFEKISQGNDINIAMAHKRDTLSLGVMKLIALAYGRPPQIVEKYPDAPLQNYSAIVIGWFRTVTKRFIQQKKDGSSTDLLIDIAQQIDTVFEYHLASQQYLYPGQYEAKEATEILQMINRAITDPEDPHKVRGNIAKKLGTSESVLMEVIRMITLEKDHPPILTSADIEMILLQYFIGTQHNVSDAIRTFIANYYGDIEKPVTAPRWSQYYNKIRLDLPKLAEISHFIAHRDQETMRIGLKAMKKSLDQHSQP